MNGFLSLVASCHDYHCYTFILVLYVLVQLWIVIQNFIIKYLHYFAKDCIVEHCLFTVIRMNKPYFAQNILV